MARPLKTAVVWGSVILVISPLLWMFITALRPESETLTYPVELLPNNLTLEHFSQLLFETEFPRLFTNSTIVAFGTSLIVIVCAMPAAFALARYRFSGRTLFSTSLLFTYLMPPSIIVIPLYLIIARLGLADSLLGLVITYTTFTLPFALLLLRSFIEALPHHMEDAARVDGASPVEVFFEIVVPQALPGLGAVSIFTFIVAFNEYLFALVFLTSSSRMTLPVGIVSIVKTPFEVHWNVLMAAAVLMTLPVMGLAIFLQRYLISGFALGGLKG